MFLFDEQTKPQCLLEAKAPVSSMHVYLTNPLTDTCAWQFGLIIAGIVALCISLCCCAICCIGGCIWIIQKCCIRRDDPYPNVPYSALKNKY